MQIQDLLKLLNEKQAEYIVIGAQACAAHGYVRATDDIDILIYPTERNIERVRSALEAFGYDTTDASLEDFQQRKILFRQYWFDVDIHPFATGVKTEEAFQNRVEGIYEGIPTEFPSLEDLIKMKEAANRPKDQEDLLYLREIQRQLKNKK